MFVIIAIGKTIYERREGRSSLSRFDANRRPELARFQEYSSDPLNSLYVSSSLALLLGEKEPSKWGSQSSLGSEQHSQPRDADTHTGQGPGFVSPRDGPSQPRSHGDGWCLKNEGPITGDRDSVSPPGLHADEEMFMAATLLQAIGQDYKREAA